jgi:fibronectin-binding autotransporter adhesin
MKATRTATRGVIGAAVAVAAAMAWPGAARAEVKFWDINGTGTESGGPSPAGTWDTTLSNWNTDPAGGAAGVVGPFVSGDDAVFSAGSDATGAYTVTITGTQTAASISVRSGTAQFVGGIASSAGTTTVSNGATLSIDASGRLAGAGAVVLNGGTLLNANATSGSTFSPTAKEIQIGSLGGAVGYTGTAAQSSLFSGTITGAGNTLTKVGTGEFRAQGANTANYTFAKLVVNQGLYRLGSVISGTQTTMETGFGAAPGVVTTDAITLKNGGAIGASFAALLAATRGITIDPTSGTFNGTGGSLSIPGPLSGSGLLIITGTGGATLSNVGNVSTFTGSLQADGLLVLNESLNVQSIVGGTAGSIGVAATKVLTVGMNGASTTYAGRVTGAGSFTKIGGGTLTLSPTVGEFTNTGGVNITAGTLKYGTSTAGLAATVPVTIEAGALLDMNAVNDSFGSLSGPGRVIGAANGSVVSNLTLSATTTTVTSTFTGTLEQSGTFTKSAAATQILAGTAANTYGGITTILGGTLGLNKTPGVNAVPTNVVFGSNTVTGGTLRLLAANQVADTASVTFQNNAGVLDLNGFSETLGTLALTRTAAPTTFAAVVAKGTLDFGTAATANTVRFANSSGIAWDPVGQLTVMNWNGNVDIGGGADQIFVGTDGTGLTTEQAGLLKFLVPGTPSGFLYGAILPTGEVVASTTAVPEPSAVVGLAALATGGLLRRRRTARA